ncbi:uncharacterized protein [Haliotis asinina]|uniref:uncharacterized protein n=1 Tax=Haliotis asinina TaxID=109174 RepID=UPI003531E9ED
MKVIVVAAVCLCVIATTDALGPFGFRPLMPGYGVSPFGLGALPIGLPRPMGHLGIGYPHGFGDVYDLYDRYDTNAAAGVGAASTGAATGAAAGAGSRAAAGVGAAYTGVDRTLMAF